MKRTTKLAVFLALDLTALSLMQIAAQTPSAPPPHSTPAGTIRQPLTVKL